MQFRLPIEYGFGWSTSERKISIESSWIFLENLEIFENFEIFTFPSASLADRPETVKPTKLSFKMLKSVPGRAETSKHAFRVEFEIST